MAKNDPPILQGRGGTTVSPRSLAAQIPGPRVPSADQRAGNYTTKTATFITKPGSISILHAADLPWTRVQVLLETAGPVSISTAENFNVTSGQGIALQTGVPQTVTIPKGSRLYITSTTTNRVSYIVEPVPWLEQILGAVMNGLGTIAALLKSFQGR